MSFDVQNQNKGIGVNVNNDDLAVVTREGGTVTATWDEVLNGGDRTVQFRTTKTIDFSDFEVGLFSSTSVMSDNSQIEVELDVMLIDNSDLLFNTYAIDFTVPSEDYYIGFQFGENVNGLILDFEV